MLNFDYASFLRDPNYEFDVPGDRPPRQQVRILENERHDFASVPRNFSIDLNRAAGNGT
jgi:hypothetical protein